jgi:uncharacterized protein
MSVHRSRGMWIWCAALVFAWTASASSADPPTAKSVFLKMKSALEPAKSSTRTLTFKVYSKSFNETRQIVARQARKSFPNGARCVTVVISPDSLKGVTVLVQERPAKSNEQYLYLPAMRRMRELIGPGQFEPFLGSDFTYADVGLADIHDRSLKLLGEKTKDGTKAYELQETPSSTWYYLRIVDWIAVDSGLPLERDHYDVSNKLWRKQIFEDVAEVNGVPTPMHVRVDDLESGDWSDYRVDDLQYDVSVPDAIFDPNQIGDAASNSVWSK